MTLKIDAPVPTNGAQDMTGAVGGGIDVDLDEPHVGVVLVSSQAAGGNQGVRVGVAVRRDHDPLLRLSDRSPRSPLRTRCAAGCRRGRFGRVNTVGSTAQARIERMSRLAIG